MAVNPSEAVRVAKVARDVARGSVDRLIIHLEAGSVKGIAQEVKFLDALDRNARQHVSRLTGVRGLPAPQPLGAKTLKALRGSRARYAKASVLSSFSRDIMEPLRIIALNGWIWTANSSACAACLLEHGRKSNDHEVFAALHPSCLCFPDVPGKARKLTSREIGDQLISRGGRDAHLGNLLRSGQIQRGQLVSRRGSQVVQRNKLPKKKQSGVSEPKTAPLADADLAYLADDFTPITSSADEIEAALRRHRGESLIQGSDPAANGRLEQLYGRQGFHEKPTLMTGDELAAQPGPALLRGVPEKRMLDNYIDDAFHRAGRGVYGDGTYSALADTTGILEFGEGSFQITPGDQIAKLFGSTKDQIISIKFKSGARLVDYRELESVFSKYLSQAGSAGIRDLGEFATALGYDGIVVEANRYHIILNRGATNVSRDWEQFVVKYIV